MGCRFCATGTMGIIGNLDAAEIIEQLVYSNHISTVRNVVFMGMGEPLNNYENVKSAALFFTDTRLFSLCKSLLVLFIKIIYFYLILILFFVFMHIIIINLCFSIFLIRHCVIVLFIFV